MKFCFIAALAASTFLTTTSYAATSTKVDCREVALKAGYYFAKLNADKDEMKLLVVQRATPDKLDSNGDTIVGLRYFLRSPAGDLNYCNVFIALNTSKCVVYDISASSN